MKRIVSFFQTLRGKLILTYTTVTVLALLALEILILVVFFAFSNGLDTDTEAYLGDVIAVLPSQARSYLQPGATDLDGLQAWLSATYESGYASLPPQGVFDSPAATIAKSSVMYVLDPKGKILAAAPADEKTLVGRTYSPPQEVARSQAILENAFALATTAGDLSAVKPDGTYLVAVPVTQNQGDGPLIAVIVVTVKAPSIFKSSWWPIMLAIVFGTGLILLMAVAPFGAIFGFIMSSGLTRRLKALTTAADAWSEGDFSVQPQADRGKDEISYLGLRMRRMAEHIQGLLQTRHELALMEERNRLARELHDTVKQETFATLMQVRAAKNLLERDPVAARQHLDEAEELIKSSQKELGLMIAELRPAALEGQGLGAALDRFFHTWSQHACIPVEFQVQNEQSLPLDIEQTLYRVVQEALSNVARHSRASVVKVHLAYEPGQVSIRIADNGVGFDPSTSPNGGFGLQSMRDRITTLGGALKVDTTPGNGVTLTATVPMHCQEIKNG